jgi:hypothetical protein
VGAVLAETMEKQELTAIQPSAAVIRIPYPCRIRLGMRMMAGGDPRDFGARQEARPRDHLPANLVP